MGMAQEKKISELTNKYNNALQQNTDLAVYIILYQLLFVYRRSYKIKVMKLINYYQR